MSLFIPDSFYYGDTFFPWEGRIEPKFLQRKKWLLLLPSIIGKIPVISMEVINSIASCIAATTVGVLGSQVSYGVEVFGGVLNSVGVLLCRTPQDLAVSQLSFVVCAVNPTNSIQTSQNAYDLVLDQTCVGLNINQSGVNVLTVHPRSVSMK
jgi:hypothetical protein